MTHITGKNYSQNLIGVLSQQSNSKFRDALNLSVCTKKISDFLGENFENSLNGVEKANRIFTDILITASKTSLKHKRNTVSKHKKQRNGLIMSVKGPGKKITTLSNLKYKNPCDPVLRQTCAETLKGYKNVCDKNRKQFWGCKINDQCLFYTQSSFPLSSDSFPSRFTSQRQYRFIVFLQWNDIIN